MKITPCLKKDTFREIRKGKSRFISIVILVALAVMFLFGLRVTAPDMEATADAYFDAQSMMDVRIVSTLGITEEDVSALSETDGVLNAEGSYGIDAVASSGGDLNTTVRTLSVSETMNVFYLIEGRLPQSADECIVEEEVLEYLELEIGDSLTLDTGDGTYEDALIQTEFTIVGTCLSPLYASTSKGTSSLGSGKISAIIGLSKDAYALDYFTDLYITVEGAADMQTYSDEYEEYIEEFTDSIEELANERAALRLKEIQDEAQEEIDDGWDEYNDAKLEAEEELAAALSELEDARAELDTGWDEYYDGLAQTEEAEEELADAKTSLDSALETLNSGESSYKESLAEYETGLAEYEESLSEYEESYAAYEEGLSEYNEGLAEYEESYAAYEAALSEYEEGEAAYSAYAVTLEGYGYTSGQISAAPSETRSELDSAKTALDETLLALEAAEEVLDASKAELDSTAAALYSANTELGSAKAALDDAKAALDDARAELDKGWEEYYESLAEYNDGLAQIETSKAELEDALITLEDGEEDYADGLAEYEEAKEEADEELADALLELEEAEDELSEINECEWYVLDRSSNSGYVSYEQEAERMAKLANFFPLIFFLVAALVCLTTMTRMVEEQRVQIGCLKALGYSRGQIAFKYVVYGISASLIGGILGLALGGTIIPSILIWAWSIMYTIQGRVLTLSLSIAVFSVGIAVLCCVCAVLAAALSALRSAPASLMRPRAPKAGKRVWLEYIKPLWKRFNFSAKVTARNLFRYQKRFWMTVIGIAGCTALVLTGFGLKDSINAILNTQFGEISLYDATVSLSEEPDDELISLLSDTEEISDYTGIYLGTADFETDAYTISGYIMSAASAESYSSYIDFHDRKSGDVVDLTEDGVIISEKTAKMLDVKEGDTITVKVDDVSYTVTISDICENYLYHYIYMTDSYYEEVFGEAPEVNTLLVHYADTENAQEDATTQLLSGDIVSSVSQVSDSRDYLEDQLQAINACMFVIIGAAAALAFVVLFNLSNINITERKRELATLKVLGFKYTEMNAYVMRESFILAFLGMIAGLILGKFLHLWLMTTIELDIAMFGREIVPKSYIFAIILTIVFSVVANILAGRKLRKIDMVESLKAVE